MERLIAEVARQTPVPTSGGRRIRPTAATTDGGDSVRFVEDCGVQDCGAGSSIQPADEIRAAWRAVAGDGHDDIIDDVLVRHGEVHRRYHTAEHVMWVLRRVADLVRGTDPTDSIDGDAIIVAALFHDAVYDPLSLTNEADSAALAVTHLSSLGWTADRREDVAALILATARHDATSATAAVLVDADLAVLGASPDEYRVYSAAVRAEYEHVPDEQWRIGRAILLRRLLERPHIFATATMAAERERQARQNMAAELDTLCR